MSEHEDLLKAAGAGVLGGGGLLAALLKLFPQLLTFWQSKREREMGLAERLIDRLEKRVDDLEKRLDDADAECNKRLADVQARLDVAEARLLNAYEKRAGGPFPPPAPEGGQA